MSNSEWITTWGTSQQLVEENNLPPYPGLEKNTIRQNFRVSLGGEILRVKISNRYGDTPILIEAVHLAKSAEKCSIIASTDKTLTFNSLKSVTIPAGSESYCDPLTFNLAPLSLLSITICFKKISSKVITGHPGSRTTSYIVPGNAVSMPSFRSPIMTDHWYVISSVDLLLDNTYGSLVVIGDSLTDGRGTTTNGNDRWTDILAERLQTDPSTKKIGIVNQGIGGNTIFSGGLGPSIIERFDHDVLGQSGIKWLILFAGVNDIGICDSDPIRLIYDLISAFKLLIKKTHSAGIRIHIATILPFEGNEYHNINNEKIRQEFNSWIRNNHELDGIIDFDAVIRDPKKPSRLLPKFDCSDHLHLNPVGYRCLADAIDVNIFKF